MAVAGMLLPSQPSAGATFDIPAQLPHAHVEAARQALRAAGHEDLPTAETGYNGVIAYVLFERLTSRSDKIDHYSIVRCQSLDKEKMAQFKFKEPLPSPSWGCRKPYNQVRFYANGTEQKIGLSEAVDSATILDIADYMFSSCLAEQTAALQEHPPVRSLRRIRGIRKTDAGYSITTDQSLRYRVKDNRGNSQQCAFTLIGRSRVIY
jgi:hypothetical protein